MPLDRLVLAIKALNYDKSASAVCAALIEPPSPAAVQRSITDLVDLEALSRSVPFVCDGSSSPAEETEELTALGLHLSRLPVDVHIGKLILLGAIFDRTNDVLTIAATLSTRTPFLSPLSRREEADAAKMRFACGMSDHLTMLRAYNEWDSLNGDAKFAFCRENFLGVRTLQAIGGLKRQLLELLNDAGFVSSGGGAPPRARAVEALGRRVDGSDGVRLALAGHLDSDFSQLPFKCDACGRIGHLSIACPLKNLPPTPRRAEGYGECAYCHTFGAGEFDGKDGTLYCHACWASYTEEQSAPEIPNLAPTNGMMAGALANGTNGHGMSNGLANGNGSLLGLHAGVNGMSLEQRLHAQQPIGMPPHAGMQQAMQPTGMPQVMQPGMGLHGQAAPFNMMANMGMPNALSNTMGGCGVGGSGMGGMGCGIGGGMGMSG